MNLFNLIPVKKPKGNLFNLSHEKKLSCNMGELIPAYVQDIVPGDNFRVNSEIFLRMAPMLAPMMHRVNVFMHYFFVPNRLVWTNWEDFITGGPAGVTSPTFPEVEIVDGAKGLLVKGALPDYMGLPISDGLTLTQSVKFSELPFRAYQMIYNEYYRDPNLTTEIAVPVGNGCDLSITGVLRKRCWEKDYFTSCLPWSQRGGDVNLPVTGEIDYQPSYKSISSTVRYDGANTAIGGITSDLDELQDANADKMRIENLDASTIYDLENVSITINDLRQSVKLQEWLEKNARGGGRYVEQILSHFGVKSSDSRLQRPEYLGGGKAPVVISEVLSTAEGATAEVGDMYGHGVSVGNTNTFQKFFEEHGYVIGILSVLPRTCYQQNIERHFLKTDKFDYYYPEFANLGEQEVMNCEVYFDHTGNKVYDGTFGYQSRYAEYKYKQSSVHGDFRDDLSYWHMGRIFSGGPTLNTSFVESDPTHRVYVVTSTDYDKLYCQIYHNVKAWRPMPKFGVPIL